MVTGALGEGQRSGDLHRGGRQGFRDEYSLDKDSYTRLLPLGIRTLGLPPFEMLFP